MEPGAGGPARAVGQTQQQTGIPSSGLEVGFVPSTPLPRFCRGHGMSSPSSRQHKALFRAAALHPSRIQPCFNAGWWIPSHDVCGEACWG